MSYKYTVGGTYKSRNRDELDKLRQKYIDTTQNYDPSKDAGYQEYAKMMREQGQLAMEDTVGKSAAATGGYGNSYAQTAGQQVYNDYARDITAAQDTFYDRALSRIAGEMNMLQDRETADKAAWEEDYLNAISDAQKAGDMDTLAKIYGFDNADDYSDSLRTALPEEEVAMFRKAASQGKADAYLEYLNSKNYDISNLYTDAYAQSALEGAGHIVHGKDGTIAATNDEINEGIKGINLEKNRNFHVSVKGNDYNLELGDAVSDKADNYGALYDVAQALGKEDSLFVYDNELYYTNGASIFEVDPIPFWDWGLGMYNAGERDKLIKAILSSQYKTED